jgi:sialate O-acetylesterase
VLTFTHAEGLVARDGLLRQLEFAPAGSDAFTPADAKIVGRQVRFPLRPAGGEKVFPMTVRYAYRQWPDGNLYNDAGLPASPFLVSLLPGRQ